MTLVSPLLRSDEDSEFFMRVCISLHLSHGILSKTPPPPGLPLGLCQNYNRNAIRGNKHALGPQVAITRPLCLLKVMGTSSMETTRKFLISLNPVPFVAERFLTRVDPAAQLSRGRARGEKTQEVDVLTSLAATVYSFSA